MTRRVLLTGATGFVGRPLAAALTAAGHAVCAIVRTGRAHRLPEKVPFESVVETPDFFDAPDAWFEEVTQGVEVVIHAAWYAEPGRYLVSPKNLDCLSGTLRFARAAARSGVRRFVGLGTCFEYDLSHGQLSVNTPLLPTTPYAASKVAAFYALSSCLPLLGVEFVWARLFYLHGEGEDPRRLAAYIHECMRTGTPAELTDGTQIRDFLDVKQAAHRIASVAMGRATGPLNICSGIPTTVRALAESIATSYGRSDLLRFGVRPANLTDPARVVGIPPTEW